MFWFLKQPPVGGDVVPYNSISGTVPYIYISCVQNTEHYVNVKVSTYMGGGWTG